MWKFLLKLTGWTPEISDLPLEKSIICVAPHTSNLDFLYGLIAYRSTGRKANFLMKDFWFFFPLGFILKKLGGIPVKRGNNKGNQSASLVNLFKESDNLHLAITPEGTRSANSNWKTGFLHIAVEAGVPIELGIIDYKNKKVIIRDLFYPSRDINKDMADIKTYYSALKEVAKYPQNFEI